MCWEVSGLPLSAGSLHRPRLPAPTPHALAGPERLLRHPACGVGGAEPAAAPGSLPPGGVLPAPPGPRVWPAVCQLQRGCAGPAGRLLSLRRPALASGAEPRKSEAQQGSAAGLDRPLGCGNGGAAAAVCWGCTEGRLGGPAALTRLPPLLRSASEMAVLSRGERRPCSALCWPPSRSNLSALSSCHAIKLAQKEGQAR